MRSILKEFVFPNDVRALPPSDDRTPLIFQIISNLFNEITFYIFNILIGENTLTSSFYIFFSGNSLNKYRFVDYSFYEMLQRSRLYRTAT